MTNITVTNQETFIIDAKVREEHLQRVDVLEKVKGLLLLPNTEYATTKQVADFYEIDVKHLNVLYVRFREELLSDGVQTLKSTEVRGLKGELQNVVTLEDVGLGKFTSSINLYTRRAILRVGMLLRDSEIAKEVRTQLLNIEEKATNEVKVTDVNEELLLQAAINEALMKGDANGVAIAATNLMAFKERYHVKELQEKEAKIIEQKTVIKTLAKEEVQFKTPNKLLHALIKRYGAVIYGSVSTSRDWDDLCYHLVNKLGTGINLKARKTRAIRNGDKNTTLMSVIKSEEFPIIIPAMIGMCENSGVAVSDIMKHA
ncbi:hypothetical protein BTGOE5_53400 [Bacillus thuringiensis]|nr:hypothetical protein BTGOE5_53400 [Bacillus thuringiensis]